MEVNNIQKFNIAYQIQKKFNAFPIIKKLKEYRRDPHVKFVSYKLPQKSHYKIPKDVRVAIIDFEGSPTFMLGILIQDTILTYYIEDYTHKIVFYRLVFNLLKIARDLWFFAFSDHERTELLGFYHYLQVQGEDISEFAFITEFPIINLQKETSRFESLTEAVYSIQSNSVKLTGDPLFRNSKLVNKLFSAKLYEEIIKHNRNCLKNESLLFSVRWYKNYKL